MYIDTVELKREYRALSKQYHPDIGGSTEAMVAINVEYQALKNNQIDYQDIFNSPSRKRATPKAKKSKPKSEQTPRQSVFTMNDIIVLLKDFGLAYWIDGNMVIIEKNSDAYDCREKLKAVGFWWDAVNKYWYWTKSHSKNKT
jgi:hypothetical protein